MGERKRQPRLIPHSSVLEISAFVNEDTTVDQIETIRHRAQLDFVLDPRVRSLDHWIPIWRERWPQVSPRFWRSTAYRESWDVLRQDVWDQYKGQALEVFLEHELKRAANELQQHETLMDDMMGRLMSGDVAPKTYEGMVSALVRLGRLANEQREELLSKFLSPSAAANAALKGRGSEQAKGLKLVSSGKGGDNVKVAQKLARIALKGKSDDGDK
jgi:hypothetical protein